MHLRIGEDGVGRSNIEDAPLRHDDDGVAELSDEVEVVLDDEQGESELLAEGADVFGEPSDEGWVDAGAGFVEQDHFRFGHESAGEFKQLALSA